MREEEPNLSNLKMKKARINSALLKIRENLSSNGIDTQNLFFDYFSLNEQKKDSLSRQKPQYCDNKKTKTKTPCKDCKELCSLSMDIILHPKNPIGQADILEELRIHHHPSSRIMSNGESRCTNEAAEELANHYSYAHNIEKPKYFF